MPDATPTPAIIVTTPDDLRSLIRAEVQSALAEFHPASPAESGSASDVKDYPGAAEFTGLSESSLRRAVQSGDLHPLNTGCRSVRFSSQELSRWMAACQPA
jgi:excisionase family DNA binding protein